MTNEEENQVIIKLVEKAANQCQVNYEIFHNSFFSGLVDGQVFNFVFTDWNSNWYLKIAHGKIKFMSKTLDLADELIIDELSRLISLKNLVLSEYTT